jgi:HK97 family phage major capsid protein
MNKELRELLDKINNKKEEARKLLAENKIEEAKALRDEIKNLQEEFEIKKDLYEEEKQSVANKEPISQSHAQEDEVKKFINAVRTKFKNAMTAGSNEDGGYTVPQDIQTKINEYRESKDALQNLVTVEPVKAPTGSRTFKKRAQQTGFVEVDEMGNIPEKATPQFTNLPYAVKKYAGFLTASNELLKDSDAAIRSVIEKWIGDESRVTRNKKILEMLDTKEKTILNGVDDIKKALNVTLDPAFRYTSKIVTNQDGFNYLDTLKDNNGRYLLQDSVSSPSGKQFLGLDVQIISNKDLPTVDNKAPFIIGDLKEAIVLFDREKTELRASDVAGDAYLTDATLFRAIERFDVKMRDQEAFVYGELDITTADTEIPEV